MVEEAVAVGEEGDCYEWNLDVPFENTLAAFITAGYHQCM